ncbi:MAG: hypothetical protein JST44_26360 [Cyanobacteria bacterium SZAS LIN-5]|nr:hypothetical protein [Cyanobacteria bacterium SZAS LIN-5]
MRALKLLLLTCMMSICCSQPSFAFDKALIGSWMTNAGNGTVRWDIRFGGACTWTKQGPSGSFTETGTLNASDGQWMKSSKSGSDSGSYSFSGTDKFVTVSSKLGRAEWTRVSGDTSASAIAPLTVATGGGIAGTSAKPANDWSASGSGQRATDAASATLSGAAKETKHGSSKLKQFFKSVAPVVGAAADIVAPSGNSSNYQPYPSNSNYETSFYPPSMGGAGGGQSPGSGSGLGRLVAGMAGGNLSGAVPGAGFMGGGDAHSLLIDNFPLPPAADDAERFGLPGLAKMAGGGMRKREFRAVF